MSSRDWEHLLEAEGELALLDVVVEYLRLDDVATLSTSRGCFTLRTQESSEMCASPSIPSSISMKAPKSANFVTFPFTTSRCGTSPRSGSTVLGEVLEAEVDPSFLGLQPDDLELDRLTDFTKSLAG